MGGDRPYEVIVFSFLSLESWSLCSPTLLKFIYIIPRVTVSDVPLVISPLIHNGTVKIWPRTHMAVSRLLLEGPEDTYLHEVNCEGFEGTSFPVHGGSDPPSKMPNPKSTNPIDSG